MAWTTPRTWVPGELVTASMLNTHLRDNLNALRSEHFLTQTFRGVSLRTHPDADVAASKVELLKADEVVMNDGTRLSVTTPLVADITASGANGLDTGTEQVSTWYEVHFIAKDDGTKALLLHRAKNYLLDESFTTIIDNGNLRDTSTNTLLAQGFKVDNTGLIEFVDLGIQRVGSPTGRIWVELRSDNSGSPSTTVLATSDKLDVSVLSTTTSFIRFVFRTPVSFTAATQYHIVLNGDFTISAVNYARWYGQNANNYANGSAKSYNGSAWSATAGVLDLSLKVYVTQNDSALTYPTGYTKSAKVGFVFNNSGGDFVPFIAVNNRVTQSSVGALGSFTTTTPTLFDISTFVPPTPVRCQLGVANSSTGQIIYGSGVPDGYKAPDGSVRKNFAVSGVSDLANINVPIAVGFIHTETQGLYGVGGGAGNSQLFILDWEW